MGSNLVGGPLQDPGRSNPGEASELVERVLPDPGAFGITDVAGGSENCHGGDPGTVALNSEPCRPWENIHPAEAC